MTRSTLSLALALAPLLACSGSVTSNREHASEEVSVTVDPGSVQLTPGQTQQFRGTATVPPASALSTAVTFTVVQPNGGTITAGGLYTAPGATGNFTVEVASVADPNKKVVAYVNVVANANISPTLKVVGKQLQDTCGNKLVLRGVEQPGTWTASQAGWWDTMALTGANATRVLVNHQDMTFQDVDDLFAKITGHGMVIYWSIYTVPPGRGVVDYMDINYWNLPEIKALYQKYKKWVVIDAGQEYGGTGTAWRDWAISRVQQLRSWGYDCPFDVISGQDGRDLNNILTYGPAVEAADTLHATIFGWQAYWYEEGHGWNSGWSYQGDQGMTLYQGIQRASEQTYPIQIGIEKFTENNQVQYMDYVGAMATAQQYGVGWLWWSWQWDGSQGMTSNGTDYTDYGTVVAFTDPNSIKNTSVKACGQ